MKHLRHFIVDYGYLFRAHLRAFKGRKLPKAYVDKKNPKGTVLLIPGLFEHWLFLKDVGDFLHERGYQVHVVQEINTNREQIHKEAAKVHRYLEQHDLKQVVIIGHSKGGLIGLHYLLNHNTNKRVRMLIAIATPFAGSTIGRYVPVKAIRELLPQGEHITALADTKAVSMNIVSVYPEYDNHIWHPDGSYLKGARNIVLPVQGHHRILFSRELTAAIAKLL